MKLKEWLKENKEKLVLTGTTIGSVAILYWICKHAKESIEHEKEAQAILDILNGTSTTLQDLPKPNWSTWKVEEFWTTKAPSGPIDMIVRNVPIADIGNLGEKLVSDCGLSANSVANLVLEICSD